jgi:DNA repair ATPase RecN
VLKEIHISNYQGHRNTNIKLSSGITGIIGTSLNGKTAIIRAIKQAVTNRPLGFRFQSDFADEDEPTSIQLVFDNATVNWVKTTKELTYSIEENGQTETFNKCGCNIPDIIKNKMNIEDINFQDQLASHFLITSSGGQIAKTISQVTQADKIMLWIKDIATQLSMLKTNKKILKGDIEKIDAKLITFKGMKRADRIISKIEKLQMQQIQIESEHRKIEDFLIQVEKINRKIQAHKKYLRAKPYIKRIERLEHQLEALRQHKQIILEAQQIQKDIKITVTTKIDYVKQYIVAIRRNKKCPTCFGTITNGVIRQIKKEMQK